MKYVLLFAVLMVLVVGWHEQRMAGVAERLQSERTALGGDPDNLVWTAQSDLTAYINEEHEALLRDCSTDTISARLTSAFERIVQEREQRASEFESRERRRQRVISGAGAIGALILAGVAWWLDRAGMTGLPRSG